jgi:hypothetical protein
MLATCDAVSKCGAKLLEAAFSPIEEDPEEAGR